MVERRPSTRSSCASSHDARGMAARAARRPERPSEPVTRALDRLVGARGRQGAAGGGGRGLPRREGRGGRALRAADDAHRAAVARPRARPSSRVLRDLPRGARATATPSARAQLEPAAGQLQGPGAARGALALPRVQHADLRRPRDGDGVLRHACRRRPLEPRVLRLPPRPRRRPGRGRVRATPRCPLADMAIRSDAEMLEVLRREGHPAPAKGARLRPHRGRLPGAAGRGGDRPHAAACCARPWPPSRPAARGTPTGMVLDAYLLGLRAPGAAAARARRAGHAGRGARVPRRCARPSRARIAPPCGRRTGPLDQRLAAVGGAAHRGRALRGRARHLPPRGRRGRAAGGRAARRPAQARPRRRRALHPRGLDRRPARRASPPGGSRTACSPSPCGSAS